MRTILGWITYWTSYLTFVAILLMGMSFYSMWAARGDNSYTPREQLHTISGTVLRASKSSEKTKPGRGVSYAKDRYFEIVVRSSLDGVRTLRIQHIVDTSRYGALIGTAVLIIPITGLKI